MIKAAFYATNVNHYGHVLSALREKFGSITLQRSLHYSRTQLTQLASLGLPDGFVKLLERRVTDVDEDGVRVIGLGLGQFVAPLVARLPMAPSYERLEARATRACASRVLRRLGSVDLFQFVEGLGYLGLRSGKHQRAVMERRNLHHEVFEQDIETFLGFPFRPVRDPLRDCLDEEYQRCDRIVVYSELARDSFLARGFAPERIAVVPLGLPDVGARTNETMLRDRSNIVYVGRADAYKGLDVAAAAVKRMGPSFRLTVAGPASTAARSWMAGLPHVDYVGILGKRELGHLYSTASVMLTPSVESFGFAVYEALHYGLPVVTRETTGIAGYLPTALRCTVPSRNPDQWADAALSVAEQDRDFEEVQMALRELETKLSWENAVEQQCKVYDELFPA